MLSSKQAPHIQKIQIKKFRLQIKLNCQVWTFLSTIGASCHHQLQGETKSAISGRFENFHQRRVFGFIDFLEFWELAVQIDDFRLAIY